MVTQGPRRSHPRGPGEPAGRGPGAIFRSALLGGLLALLLLVLAVFWLLPALGRRGDLNGYVEDAIRSALAVQVRIGSVETDAYSEFSITRVASLEAEAEARFAFRCERLAVFYRPLELLLGGHVRELTAHRPSLFLDLDRDLAGIVRVPEGGAGTGGYAVDRFRLSDARLELRLGGRGIVLDGLDVDAVGLGGTGDVRFEAEGRLGAARLAARGALARLQGPAGRPAAFRIDGARVEVESLDLAPLASLLGRRTVGVGGLLSLSGTAEGVWPERVEARLGSRLREGEVSAPGAPALSAGEAGLEVLVRAHGELERVEFQVDFQGEGDLTEAAGPRRARVALRARGEYERRPAGGEGPRVRIDEARLEAPALGQLEAHGAVLLGRGEPRWALELRVPRLAVRDLERHPLGLPLRGLLRFVEGDLEAAARLAGPLPAPEAAVEWRLLRGGLLAGEGKRIPAALSGRAGRIAARGPTVALEQVELTAGGIDLRDLLPLLGLPEASADLRGKLEATCRSGEVLLGGERHEAEAELRIAEGSLSIPAARLEAPAFEASGKARVSIEPGRSVGIRLEAALVAGEFALGRVVETPGRDPIPVSGTLTFAAAAPGPRCSLELAVRTPSAGPAEVRGVVEGGGDGVPRLDLQVTAASIPNERFLATYLRDPFRLQVGLLEGASFCGTSAAELRIRGPLGALGVEGRLRARGLGARLAGVAIDEVSLDLPLRLGAGAAAAPEAAGLIEVGRVKSRALDARGLRVPLVLAGETYRFPAGAIALPFLGGWLEAGAVELRPFAAGGERLRLALAARDLDLPQVLALRGGPPIPGRIHLEVRGLGLSEERLDLDGGLALEVFGGRIELHGLSIEHPLEPYRVFRLSSGEARAIDLGRLGREVRFGLASGVLEGRVRDLVATGSEVAGFEVDFETVETPGVPQYINRNAIESIQRVIAGPFGFLEATFFSKFRYAGFGFRARLRDGRFRLEGKHRRDGVEYIMYGRWYQLPRVSIVNSRPGIDYDWDVILENLRSIYRGKGRSAEGERR